MNIKLSKNWSVKTDRYEYRLVRKDKNGREFSEGHYSSLESCILGFLELKIKLSNAQSIQQLLDEIKSTQTALNSALQPLKLVVQPLSKKSPQKTEQNLVSVAPNFAIRRSST